MKALGLVALLITIVLGVMYVVYTSNEVSLENNYDDSQTTVYEEALDSAQEAVSAGSGGAVVVYEGISYPENTTQIDLSGRNLTGSLKAEIRLLQQLEVLNISDNDLTGIPAEIGQLSQLRVLDLSNNPFTGLPLELGNLENLEVLDLTGTDYAVQDLEAIKESLPASVEIRVD